MVAAAALVFPKLALGLSGFETGVSVMPLVRGAESDDPNQPKKRIANTRKLLLSAALIMSVMLMASSIVTVSGDVVHLTPKEYDLLHMLINNANRVLTHRQLLSKIWGVEYADDHHSLRVHIANLRNKIESDPTRPQLIQTETRIGYRFVTTGN
jgi:DNA-binding response OmpR family regulator